MFQCLFEVSYIPALAVIEGGSETVTTANELFIVNGSGSVDPEAKRQLMFLWTCQIVKGGKSRFCNNKFTGQ